MATHYDVLGVSPSANSEQIRRAYRDKARLLHPDRLGPAGHPDDDPVPAAMHEVNEAWRVLRDPSTRAAYDRSLQAVEPVEDDWLDRPYPRPPADPGDLTVALVRAVPWIAVLVVLGAIFVFTAFARSGDESNRLVGACVAISGTRAEEVSCDAPNAGRVTDVVDREALCTDDTTPRRVLGGEWLCLRDR